MQIEKTVFDSTTILSWGLDALECEAKAISSIKARLDENFVTAVNQILCSAGRVIVCGMGKSGLIGKKIAATLASTGTPSLSMHPAEAYHGDLGMVTPSDVFIAISNSGETDEVVKLLPFLRDNRNFLVAITGNPSSTLARAANCHLDIGAVEEACPLQLAPTSSTTATLALGDALSIALMRARGFSKEGFARFHPGGSLGRRLLCKVEDEMVVQFPVVSEDTPLLDILRVMSEYRLGLTIVSMQDNFGIITDGDIRRAIEQHKDVIFERCAAEIMTSAPHSVAVGTRVEDALALMEREMISSLLVRSENRIVGIFRK